MALLTSAINMESGCDSISLTDRRNIVSEMLDRLDQVAVMRHPLGFIHFDVGSMGEGISVPLRFHVWTGMSLAWSDPLGKSHDHVWNLTSLVVAGALTDSALVFEEAAQGNERIVEIVYSEDGNQAESNGQRVVSREISKQLVEAGSVYRVSANAFHRTDIVELPTATLVIARPGSPAARPRIIASLDEGATARAAPRSPIAVEDARSALQQVLDCLHEE